MIGVVSKLQEREVVEEFFELFKTPWEFYIPGKQYEVLLVAAADVPEEVGSLTIVYGTEKCRLDVCEVAEVSIRNQDFFIEWGEERLPIYGTAITFSGNNRPILFCDRTGQMMGYETRKGGQRILRVGYNLFDEVYYLLSAGQPPHNASIPTLDLHIAMLRNWIVETGVPLVEIPPIPEGYRFCACLTHDIDFIGIRRHFLDHSMWGFLYRATLGALLEFCRRKISLMKVVKNLKAACSLPLAFLGMARDPWDQFDRCLEIEHGLRSTFFFMPFKNRPGEGFFDAHGRRRGAKYDIGDAGKIIQKLLAKRCEIGVHGIDAWNSVENAKQEIRRIQEEIGVRNGIGMRTHWLCRNEHTFEILDEAGYSYDSTLGYNETVGFKAGTTQVFKPIRAKTLLELPLHIQDTALFGHGRLNASEAHAEVLCQHIINNAMHYGGVLTVLWHQRSLGAERLWGSFYEKLICKIEGEDAWFATAKEISDWFRMRRRVKFETGKPEAIERHTTFEPLRKTTLPQLVLRRYASTNSPTSNNHLHVAQPDYEDIPFSDKHLLIQ